MSKDRNDIEFLNLLTAHVKSLKAEIMRRDKLSNMLFELGTRATPKKIEKLTADLNWQCISIDKTKTTIARLFKNSILDVGTEEKEYNPSGFHNYRH